MTNAHSPAFPTNQNQSAIGLTKLEYALIHSSWEPSKDDIDCVVRRQRLANPHNDSYKPKLQSYFEIVNDLRRNHFIELLNS